MAKPPTEREQRKLEPINSDFNGELAQEVAKRISSLVPAGQQAQIVAQMVSLVQQESFRGPIAHPKHLREYEQICPGAADRIVAMAERNLAHNQDIQSQSLTADIGDAKSGKLYGFLTLVLLVLSALGSGYFENTTLALAFLTAGALGVISQFIKGRGSNGAS